MVTPTIVAASLSDQELRESIDKLVNHVKKQTNAMAEAFTGNVDKMRKALQSLGDGDAGKATTASSKSTQAQKNEVAATEQNIAAKDKLVKKNKEVAMTFDQLSTIVSHATAQQSRHSQSGIQAFRSYREEIQRAAEETKRLFNENPNVKQYYSIISNVTGRSYNAQIFAENDARANGLSIEAQILQVIRQKNEAEKQYTRELANANSELQKGADIEEKRRYKAPTVGINTSFNKMLANSIGLSENDVTNTRTDIKTLELYIKQLRQSYISLTDAEKSSPFGVQLRQELQYTERVVQQARTELSRPISLKDALGGSEKTLDDIAYKMRRLQSYKQGIDLTKPNAVAELNEVNVAYGELQKKMDKYIAKGRQISELNNALGRSWNYMKNRLAFYFTVGASTQFVKQLIDIRGQYELLERSIGILIDSAQNGSRIFAELNAMAIKSPFTTMELGAAAKQLVAYDVAAKDVVDTTRRLADMASAVGIPIERLTYALGQIKAYGYLNARDARMFANAGIPLVKELADRYTELEGRLVSTSDVYDRIKKKAISYTDVMDTVNKMTDEGGKFFNFQEKASDTLRVKIANLTLAWNNMLNEIGKDNQGLLGGMLNITKNILNNWRNINNMLISIAANFGVIKAIQIARLLMLQKEITYMRTLAVIQTALGKGAATFIHGISQGVKSLANPVTLAIGAFTAFTVLLTKALIDYQDLQKANDEFNKSIVTNAQENIDAIDKFFSNYEKQLRGISGAPSVEQQKMWERIQEEIESTTKNAKEYIQQLEEISDLSKRIKSGEAVLSQSREIEKEVKRLAERGTFDLGGGFADDSLADNLIAYEEVLREIIKDYGSVQEAGTSQSLAARKIFADYKVALEEVGKELDGFTKKLSNADISVIMGDDPNTQLANIREYGNIIRDNFLATERGQKITSDGQAKINSALDAWVAKQAMGLGLIDLDVYKIEAQRTAWETFFEQLNAKDKERLDYLVSTNQTASKDFEELWDKAAKNMARNATTSYELIQDQIARLRDMPDIVINVVYKETTEKESDKQREQFEERYIEPKNIAGTNGKVSVDEYMAAREENTKKYARYIKQEGEDNVEWEKRLGEQYQANAKSIKSLNEQLSGSAKLSDIDREAKQNELTILDSQQKVLKQIAKDQNFNYEQFEKGRKGSKKDPVLDALKREISLVEKLQSDYDKLTKSGASQAEALATIRGAYGTTMKQLSSRLRGYGLPDISTALITGSDPNKALEHFKNTLETLVKKGMLNLERSKEVEAVIEKFTISAKTYNLEKVTKGLNNELDKLKDEYELAVEMDATPELSNIFMDMMGLDEEQMSQLPRTAEQVAKKAQEAIDKVFSENNISTVFNLESNRNKAVFDEWVKQNGQDLEDGFVKQLDAIVDYVNKVRLDETKKQLEEWDKLLEKYAEYETKRKRIIDEASRERDIALKRGAGSDILDAIELRKIQELAKLDFDEFKKGAVWQTAISDLSSLTTGTLRDMADALERYKKSAKGLTSKELKEINKTIKSIRKELRGDNPFSAIANAIDEAHERMELFDDDIQETQQKLLELIDKNKDNEDWTAEDIDEYDRLINKLNELLTLQQKAGKVSLSYVIGQLDKYNDMATKIGETLKSWGEALDNEKLAKAGEIISDVSTNIAASFSGAQAGSSVSGGNWVGALVGAIVGGLSDLVPKIAKWSKEIRNSDIDKSLEASKDSVEILKNSYQDLEYQIERAYGAAVTGAQRAILFNKKLQLAELERQLLLEKSRSSKDQDIETIRELEGQIAELRNGIKSDLDDITNDLLGISGVNSAAENLVSSMIDAFKKGEDYMQVYEDSFEKMVDNMIMKAIVAKIIGQRVDAIFSAVQERADARAENDPEVIRLKNLVSALKNEIKRYESGTQVPVEGDVKQAIARDEERIKQAEKELADAYTKASVPNVDDIKDLSGMWNGFIEQDQAAFEAYMEGLGIKYGQDAEGSNLSALQQGIQGITEDTAGALEAITNGISQQCYLQSDLLTQIRDAILGFDIDVSNGTQAEMLLQLQNSYQTQESIRSILEGVLSPSGRAFTVEMV